MGLFNWFRSGRPKEPGNNQPQAKVQFQLDGDDGYHLQVAREARAADDYNTARLMYQKCAYGVTMRGSDKEKRLLKEEQTQFAKADPLYREIISQAKGIVTGEPGILQTELYKRLPHDREEIQSALYFGHELRDLRREKKGRSYMIFPAELN
jgi:hypothetical protein